ncbi:MAG TPA: DUF3465 domain-containing protein [Candidatus Baltobacteraceae bacterium]|nr:DUF3465 domain-containing protein [Candidatus Baltobacteraceae bacterium]
MRLLRIAACAAVWSACSPPPVDSVARGLQACSSGARHDEVRDRARVVRVLGVRGAHEGFIIAAAGRTLLVEDNVDLTGVIPLRAGSAIAFQGQLECNDGVIHWTHRDPAGRHVDGYIVLDGRTYR